MHHFLKGTFSILLAFCSYLVSHAFQFLSSSSCPVICLQCLCFWHFQSGNYSWFLHPTVFPLLLAFQLFRSYFTVCNYLLCRHTFYNFASHFLFLTAPSLLSFQHFLFLLWHDSCTYQQFSCMFFAIRGVVLLIPFIYNTVAGGVTEVRNR